MELFIHSSLDKLTDTKLKVYICIMIPKFLLAKYKVQL